jgi:O-antigen/teichoic acid export membrane protein
MLNNILYSLLTKGLVGFLNFWLLIISSRYLGVSTRGEISIFLLNIAIIQAVSEIYTGYGIVRFVSRYNLKKIVGSGIIFILLVSVLLNFCMSALSKQVPGYTFWSILLTILVLTNTFCCVIILARQDILLFSKLSFMQPFLLAAGLFFSVFVLDSFTFEAYFFPLFFSFLLVLIVSAAKVMSIVKSTLHENLFELKPIIVNGFLYQSSVLLLLFVNRYSFYVLPDNAKVGLYSSACALMEAVLIVAHGIAPVVLARVAAKGGSEAADVTFALSKVCLLFSLAVIFLVAVIPESLFIALLGKGFYGIKGLMLLYSPAVAMASVFIVIASYFNGKGWQKPLLFSYGLGCFCSLSLAPVLIAKFGVRGAAFTAVISYFLIAVSMCVVFLRRERSGLLRFFSIREDILVIRKMV